MSEPISGQRRTGSQETATGQHDLARELERAIKTSIGQSIDVWPLSHLAGHQLANSSNAGQQRELSLMAVVQRVSHFWR